MESHFSVEPVAEEPVVPDLCVVVCIELLNPAKGAVQARRIEVSRARFAALLKGLYRQLSRQESLDVANSESASRQFISY